MSKYVGIIVGSALLATVAIFALPAVPYALTALAKSVFITAGTSLLVGGVGTLLTTKSQLGGFGSASRNPIAPWGIDYSRCKVGGTIVFLNEFGDDNKYLDLVIVLAAHPCQSVDALLFDNQRVPIDGSGDSYTPTQVSVSISSLTRSKGVVTMVTAAAFSDIQDGDNLKIQLVSTDPTLNGTYPVERVSSTEFRYVCGGFDISLTGEGVATTTWPDYRSKVHMEVLLGNQDTTFPGMLYGTPYDGDSGTLVINGDNPWTAAHVLKGKTAVFLRLHYNDTVFANGLPGISFRIHGKNDIYDPRTAGTPLERPTIYLNGWGPNAHEGAYEMGVDQAHGWGLDSGTTYAYDTPDQAIDGDTNSYANCSHRHTHKYAGCIWSFAALSSTPSALWLNILSEVPSTGSGMKRSAGIWYSIDGGTTWIQVYDVANRAKQWDGIHLSTSQDASLLQVMAFLDSHDDMAHRVYDVQLATGPAGSGYGYTANAALCIADYLSNPVWGFRAKYGTEIPLDKLIAAANICDEAVPLADGSTEPRYECNGTFSLSLKRGEILQNLLTSCGGRLTYSEGEFVIHPAAWEGPSLTIGGQPIASATLSLLSSHIPGTGYTGVALGNTGTIALIGGTTPFLYDGSAWTNRIDTSAMDPADSANWHCTLGIDGSLFGSAAPPDQFLIYDCWIDVTYADGSTAVWRSTFPQVIPSIPVGAGDVLNPGNAIDGDTASCATIERHSFASTGRTAYLRLSQFVPAVSPAPPDTSESGMAQSALALSMAAGPFQWKSKVSARDLYNGVKGTYISPVNSWESSDIPPYAQDPDHGYPTDANLAEDNGERRWFDMQLPFTISTACAQRLAKIELLRRRQQGIGTFAFNLWAYQATALDIIDFTLPLLGWHHKLLEVVSHRFTLNRQQGEGGADVTVLGTELDLQETDPSVYEWDPSEELTAQGYQQASLPNTKIVQPPTSVAAVSGSSTTVTGADGISRSRILTSWTPPVDGYVLSGGHMEVQYQKVGDTAWTGLPTVDPSVTQVYIDGVTDGQTYNVQVRSVNAAGVPSDWVPAAPVTVSGTASALPPSSITGGGASSGDTLVWDGSAWVPGPPPSGIELETNGVDNVLQSKLNLKAGSNVTLTADTLGGVTIASSGSGGGAAGTFTNEIPAGTLNGTNTTFTLSSAPSPSGSLLLFLNGDEQLPGGDYTISGSTITYAVAPKSTDWHMAWYGTIGGATAGLVIGFVVASGTTGTNVGPMLASPRAGSLTKCVVTTKASDGSTALTFVIKKNGTSVFSTPPTVAAGTAAGTVSTFTTLTSNPLPVSASDVFSIDITAGTASWQFTAQLE